MSCCLLFSAGKAAAAALLCEMLPSSGQSAEVQVREHLATVETTRYQLPAGRRSK